MRIADVVENKNKKKKIAPPNFVAKHARVNRAATHTDRKKDRDRGYDTKHKGGISKEY